MKKTTQPDELLESPVPELQAYIPCSKNWLAELGAPLDRISQNNFKSPSTLATPPKSKNGKLHSGQNGHTCHWHRLVLLEKVNQVKKWIIYGCEKGELLLQNSNQLAQPKQQQVWKVPILKVGVIVHQ